MTQEAEWVSSDMDLPCNLKIDKTENISNSGGKELCYHSKEKNVNFCIK